MATYNTGTFINTRGQSLHYRHWPANGRPAKCYFIFHHGYGSHCAAYEPEFKQMAESGIGLFLYDAHSFGRSEPKDKNLRSLVNSPDHLVDDIYTFREKVVDQAQPQPAVPVFIGGLSMGGMTAILAAIKNQKAWQGLICVSPAVDCPRNLTLRIMAAVQGIMDRIIPGARLVPQPKIDNITLNEEQARRMLSDRQGIEIILQRRALHTDEFFDPLKVRVRMGSSFLAAWNHIAAHESELTLPILVLYSSIDKIVYPPATERFIQKVASKDVTVKGFDNYAHDLFLDVGATESCDMIIDWITSHLESATSSPPPPQTSETAKL